MDLYEKFCALPIDHAALGFELRSHYENYYCTPQNARILGCAGVDGIHYCTVPELGETVFAVSPMNFGDCVHPIAKSFSELLGFLLFCGDMAAIEQSYAWDEEQFKAFLLDCPPTEEQKSALELMARELCLEPDENTFTRIKALQTDFDPSSVPYTEDYYDPDMNPSAPEKKEWSVTFDGGFWSDNGRPGREIPLGKSFSWGGEKWHVPAVHLCDEGLVIDLVAETEKELHFTPELAVNRVCLRTRHGTSLFHSPDAPDGDAVFVLEHYSLPTDRAMSIHRWSMSSKTELPDELTGLALCLSRSPERLPCGEFTTPAPFQTVTLTHPLTGAGFELTVIETEQKSFEQSDFHSPEYEYPTCFTAMSYTLTPEPEGTDFYLADADPGDPPRENRARQNSFQPEASGFAAAIGIIGGADGPTAICIGAGSKNLRTACSSLCFEHRDEVHWKAYFIEKLTEDKVITLL